MLNKYVWIKIMLIVILSLCIAYFISQYLDGMEAKKIVIVASGDITARSIITNSMLTKVEVNKRDVEILFPEAITSEEEIIGALAVVDIKDGEVLIKDTSKFIKGGVVEDNGGSGASIPDSSSAVSKSYFIPNGKRVLSVRLDSEGAMGFQLQKGDFVDVLFTSTTMETNGIYTKTLLQHIEIFDLDQISAKDKQSGLNATLQNIYLLVSPKEAQVLTLAKRKGKIDLILIPQKEDRSTVQIGGPVYPLDFISDKEN